MTETSETRHAHHLYSKFLLFDPCRPDLHLFFPQHSPQGLIDKFTPGKWVQFLVLPQTFASLLPLAVVVQE